MIAFSPIAGLLAKWFQGLKGLPASKPSLKPADFVKMPGLGEDLITDEEVIFINDSKGKCCYCRKGNLLLGPRGGGMRNCRCDSCGHEFNLMLFGGYVADGHHLNRDEPHLYSGTLLCTYFVDSPKK